jgi:hypothetical protein
MPVFESQCPDCGHIEEWYGRYEQADPFCGLCGLEMRRIVSRPNVVFTGALSASKYNNPNLPGCDQKVAHMDEQVVWRIRSSKTGRPERCVLRTWEDRRKFMKEEKLVGVEDVGDKFEASTDGRFSGTAPDVPKE